MNSDSALTLATSIAQEAGEVLMAYFRSDRMQAREKGDRDVVTIADTESEKLVLRRLQEAFPGDAIVGEEGASERGTGHRSWYIDPLDGTVNYSHGLPLWCVSISCFEGDEPVLGVIHDPLRGETYTAARGAGARLNGEGLSVSRVTRMEEALVHLTIDFHEQSLHAGLQDIQVIAPAVLRTRNTGSAALALAYLAAGYLDGMVHRLANTWDYGAGVLLVLEAGGSVTSIDGSPYTASTSALVAAASPPLQAALRDILPPAAGPAG